MYVFIIDILCEIYINEYCFVYIWFECFNIKFFLWELVIICDFFINYVDGLILYIGVVNICNVLFIL